MTQHNNWKDKGIPQIEYHILSIVRVSNIKDNATTYASASSASLQREDHLNKIYDFIDTLLIERTKALQKAFVNTFLGQGEFYFGHLPIDPDDYYEEDLNEKWEDITKLIETEE